MKRNIFVFFILIFLIWGCSDNTKLIEFNYQNKKYFIKIKDVKDDFLLTVRRHREITNDILYHKNSLFANYLSKEIAVIEEMELGLTNREDFKRKYDLLYQRNYYMDLFSKGNKILIKEMKNKLKKYQTSHNIRELEEKYVEDFKKQNIEELYNVDTNKNLIKVGEKTYLLEKLPDEVVLLKIFNKPYRWKELKDIILLFESDFTNNINIRRFQETLKNSKDLLICVEKARKEKLDKPLKIDIIDEAILKEIALENFREKMREKFKKEILTAITPEVVREYYENNKNLAIKEENGKKIQLSFNDVKEEIYNVIAEEKWHDFIRSWNEAMKKKYKVVYNDDGIKKLMKMEKRYVSGTFKNKGENLAFNKRVFASGGDKPSYACDGKDDTEWISDATVNPQWIYVDLEKKKNISSINLKWGKDYPSNLILQASNDGKNWRDVYNLTDISGGVNIVLIEKTKARFIRLVTQNESNFALKEFEIYE